MVNPILQTILQTNESTLAALKTRRAGPQVLVKVRCQRNYCKG